MPSSFEALLVALGFIAPGVAFEVGIERQVGFWRTQLSTRVLRFLVLSALYQAVLSPVSFAVWADHIRNDGLGDVTRLPVPVLLLGAAWLVLPFLAGLVVGWRTSRGDRWTQLVVGRDPEPRAWDRAFFAANSLFAGGYVRARLKDDDRTWVAGVWAYSSSHPDPEDVLLSPRLACDPKTGELALDPDSGETVSVQWDLLLERSNIDLLEFQPILDPERAP